MDAGRSALPPLDLDVVFERAPLGLGVISADGRYVRVNPALAALLGSDPEDVVGQHATSFLHPDDCRLAEVGLHQLFHAAAEQLAADLRYVRHDGTEVHARMTAARVPDPQGRTTAVVLQTEDVTAERAAAAAQREISSLVAVLDEAVLTVDSSGCVRTWNAAAERLLGWSAAEMVGAPVARLVGQDHSDAVPALLEQFCRGLTVRTHASAVHKSGSLIEVGVIATPTLDATGRLVSGIGVLHDIAEQKLAAERLEHLARHDPLTGLPNRREFNERLAAAMERAGRTGELVGLLFVDLDGFKKVNDERGHQVGDEFLRVVAARLHGAIRPADSLARWGGDEYSVLVGHADVASDLEAVARRLLETLNRPVHIRGTDLDASASIGIATSTTARHPDEILDQADKAMYRAKHRGGNRYAWAHDPAVADPGPAHEEPA